MLSIRNLSKVYAGGKKAVDNMNIDIESRLYRFYWNEW